MTMMTSGNRTSVNPGDFVPQACIHDASFQRTLEQMVRKACYQAGRPELIEDAMQEAWTVCLQDLEQYDESKGSSLFQFLRPRIHWAVLHFCRNNSSAFSIPARMWRKRRQSPAHDLSPALYTLSLQAENPANEDEFDTLSQIPDGDSVGGVYCGRIARDCSWDKHFEYEHLNTLIERLSPSERAVVHYYSEGMGCAAIARQVGVTRQRVHQVLHRAFDKIRDWWDEPVSTAAA